MTDLGDYVSKVAEEVEDGLPATKLMYILSMQTDGIVKMLGIHPDMESAQSHAQSQCKTPLTWLNSEKTSAFTTFIDGKDHRRFRYVINKGTAYPKDHFKEIA